MRWLTMFLAVGCVTDTTVPVTDSSAVQGVNQAPMVTLSGVEAALDDPVLLEPVVADPDGDELTFRWLLRRAPALSRAQIDDAATQTATFVADRVGSYVVDLTVFDGTDSTFVSALVQVTSDTEPVAELGDDRLVAVNREVLLDGTASTDPDGARLSYAWELLEVPTGSAATLSGVEPLATFLADAVGSYRAALTVHNGSTSVTDEVVIEALPDDITPGAVHEGDLLAGEVYAMGGIDAKSFCEVGFAHWSDFDSLGGGLDVCLTSLRGTPRLDPNGAVLYLDRDGVVRSWACDACPTWSQGQSVPKDYLANDPIVDTDVCDAKGGSFPIDFSVGPGGERAYLCSVGGWVDGSGRSADGFRFSGVWLGEGSVGLSRFGGWLDFDADTYTPVKGLPTQLVAARWSDGGFWAVSGDTLWFVDAKTQAASVVYDYPPLAKGESAWYHALDAAGTLHQVVQDPTGRFDLRRGRLDGLADSVRTVGDGSTWMGIPRALITGP